jgi:hypothetical protein
LALLSYKTSTRLGCGAFGLVMMLPSASVCSAGTVGEKSTGLKSPVMVVVVDGFCSAASGPVMFSPNAPAVVLGV